MTLDGNGNHIPGSPTSDEPASAAPQSPAPNPQAGVAGKIAAVVGAHIDPNAQKSKADKYGLGAWGQTKINTAGLFDHPSMTTDEALQTFLQWSQDPTKVGVVAAIQQALFMAGNYYSASYHYLPGVVRPADQSAFAKFLTQNAQTQGDTLPTLQKPIATTLQDNAQRGVAFGSTAVTPTAQKVYALPNTADLEAQAMTAAQKVLGRKATTQEAAAFAAYYRHIVTNYDSTVDGSKAQAKLDAQNNVTPASGNDVNAQGVPLSAADATQGLGSPTVMGNAQTDAATMTGLDSTNGLIQQNLQHQLGVTPTDPVSFMQHIADVAGVSNAQNATDLATKPALTVDSPPDAGVAAENFLRDRNPGESQQTNLESAMGSFLRVISGRMS